MCGMGSWHGEGVSIKISRNSCIVDQKVEVTVSRLYFTNDGENALFISDISFQGDNPSKSVVLRRRFCQHITPPSNNIHCRAVVFERGRHHESNSRSTTSDHYNKARHIKEVHRAKPEVRRRAIGARMDRIRMEKVLIRGEWRTKRSHRNTGCNLACDLSPTAWGKHKCAGTRRNSAQLPDSTVCKGLFTTRVRCVARERR